MTGGGGGGCLVIGSSLRGLTAGDTRGGVSGGATSLSRTAAISS